MVCTPFCTLPSEAPVHIHAAPAIDEAVNGKVLRARDYFLDCVNIKIIRCCARACCNAALPFFGLGCGITANRLASYYYETYSADGTASAHGNSYIADRVRITWCAQTDENRALVIHLTLFSVYAGTRPTVVKISYNEHVFQLIAQCNR